MKVLNSTLMLSFLDLDNFFLLMKSSAKPLSETVARRCSAKKMFLNISQNSLESTCVGASFLIKYNIFFTACLSLLA